MSARAVTERVHLAACLRLRERLSAISGAFIYCSKILTLHRIHQDSETTKILKDNERTKEDLYMFRKFWPEGIARILCSLYSTSEKSNEM